MKRGCSYDMCCQDLRKQAFLSWQSCLVIKTQVLWHLESDSFLVTLPKSLSFTIHSSGHSSDTDSHFLFNTLKLFWVSFFIFLKSILDQLIFMRENYFSHLSVS